MDAWVSDCSWLVPYLDVEGMISIIGDMSPWPKEWCPTVCGVLLVGVVCWNGKKSYLNKLAKRGNVKTVNCNEIFTIIHEGNQMYLQLVCIIMVKVKVYPYPGQ